MQATNSRLVLSRSDLNDYVECPHLTTLALEVARGVRRRPHVPDDHGALLRRKSEEHEAAYLAAWTSSGAIGHRFSFPPPQHKLAPGDTPVDPATGKGVGTIVEMEEAAGTVILRRGPSHASIPLPTALIPPGPIQTNAQRNALARLGEAMLAGKGRYRALEDILDRKPPRLGGGFSGPIQTMDLREQRERAAALDQSYLFIQGAAGHRQDVDGRADRRGSHPPPSARRRRCHEPQGHPQPARRDRPGGAR